MNYKKFFDGSYYDDAGRLVYTVTSLSNPSGFIVKAEKTGKKLYITVEDALILADTLELNESYSNSRKYLNLQDLVLKNP